MGGGKSSGDNKDNVATKGTGSNQKIVKQKKNIGYSGEIKIVLLGSGESGKSTLQKQIRILHNQPHRKDELETYAPHIIKNVYEIFIGCIESCRKANPTSPFLNEKSKKFARMLEDPELKNAMEDPFETIKLYDQNIFDAILSLFDDTKIHEAFQRRDFPCFDGADYFFKKENLERYTCHVKKEKENLWVSGFTPTEDDILRCRKKTTGIIEMKFQYQGVSFTLVDVGGQVMERKKWPRVFENVTHLIFVSSLADFDELMFEDGKTIRLLDALDLFEATVNSQAFIDKPVILFLNKEDVFRRKIQKKNLLDFFQDYDGTSHDYEKGIEFIKRKFESLVKNNERLKVHFCHAIDIESVKKEFTDVKNMIVDEVNKSKK